MYSYRKLGKRAALLQLGIEKTAGVDSEDTNSFVPLMAGLGAAALGGGAGYKLLRKQRLSDNPALRSLQEQIGNKPMELATHAPTNSRFGRAIRRILYGAPDISDDVATAARQGTPLKRDTAVLHHGDPTSQLPVEGAVDINAPSQGLTSALSDKDSFSKILKQIEEQNPGTKIAPATENLGDVIKAFDGDLDKMTAHLKGALPEGWLIKPKDESLGNVSSFISDQTPLTGSKWLEAQKNPQKFILQEKLPIKQEYRVHALQGKPFTATRRRLPEGKLRNAFDTVSRKMGIGEGGFGHIPIMGKKRKALNDFVERTNLPMQEAYRGAPTHQAFDIAELPDGSFRYIESNPTPGTTTNPFVSRKLQELASGRMHKDKAVAGATGIGAATGAAGYSAASPSPKKEGQ